MKTSPPVDHIRNVIILASYQELANLEIMLTGLTQAVGAETALIVADDSTLDVQARVRGLALEVSANTGRIIVISSGINKTGRGAAIRRGFGTGVGSIRANIWAGRRA
jgi:hypothetical protein